ncbi:hypothetical protein FEF26_13985 [Nesterenkonia salmonea]|uniref:Uncharacterized protein n=1 Tax=Nesterenkonia salmonea TaxID=1804987 RepID=A0A5R9B7G6_9MICC|nr:hypothetical protein [Nesterenkonia salmonea]TLP93048.1 hypothetical protein FEF26_13985 [Nesterenkonia salmonea]
MKGLSTRQLALAGSYGLGLLITLIAVIADQWRLAAAAGIVSFALFSALIVLTLAAMTDGASRARKTLRELNRSSQGGRSGAYMRRIARAAESNVSRLDRSIHEAEARREASEQRLLATLESHRMDIDDRIADLVDSINHSPNHEHPVRSGE